MAKWYFKIEIGDLINNDDSNSALAAKEIAIRLKALGVIHNNMLEKEKQYLIEQFEDFSESGDEDEDVEAFDYLLGELYDWGDSDFRPGFSGIKCCWVNSFAMA